MGSASHGIAHGSEPSLDATEPGSVAAGVLADAGRGRLPRLQGTKTAETVLVGGLVTLGNSGRDTGTVGIEENATLLGASRQLREGHQRCRRVRCPALISSAEQTTAGCVALTHFDDDAKAVREMLEELRSWK